MSFFVFFLKILPLYILIAMGFFTGRKTKIQALDFATINLNFFSPIVFFNAISRLPFDPKNIALPFLCFSLQLLLVLITFFIIKIFTKNARTPYWLSGAAASINNGYFGIPVFILMFGQQDLGIYILYGMGSTLFSYTIINYMFIRNDYNLKEAINKIIRMPALQAIILGLICQALQWHIPEVFDDFMLTLRHAYIVTGMMIIGLVLSKQSETKVGFVFEWKLIVFLNVIRFVVFPLMSLGVVLLDRNFLHLLSPLTQKIVLMISLMPMAIDTISLAVRWRIHPERIAALILINSIVTLFAIPFLLPILLQL